MKKSTSGKKIDIRKDSKISFLSVETEEANLEDRKYYLDNKFKNLKNIKKNRESLIGNVKKMFDY